MVLNKTNSKTARDISGVGKSRIISSGSASSSSGSSGGGSQSSSSQKTVAVNPETYQPDPNSSFRVPSEQVGHPPTQTKGLPPGDYRNQSLMQNAKQNAQKLEGQVNINPQNLIASNVQGVNQVAIQGSIPENIQRSQVIHVAVDSQAVKDYNAEMAKAGINNAQDYFQAVKRGAIETNPQQSSIENPPFMPIAPKTASVQETQPHNDMKDLSGLVPSQQKSGGVLSLAKKDEFSSAEPFLVKEFYALKEGYVNYNLALEKPGNELLILSVIPVSATVGALKGGTNLIEGGIQLYQMAPKGKDLLNPLKVGGFVSDVAFSFGEGTAEFLGGSVDLALKGDVPGLTEQLSSGFVQGEVGGRVAGGAKSLVKGAFVEYGQGLKFREVTEGAPMDTNYQFFIQSYDVNGRKGVIVPPDISNPSLGLQGIREGIAPSASELQTQLYPKRVEGIGQDSSIFSPETYQPQSFMELARKEPALAKQLAKENGQTVFNPEEAPQIRDLTAEERFKVAKEQAGIRNGELQKTLLGFKPNAEEVFILKDNQVIAKIKGKEVTIENPPIFGVEPLTASALTIYQNREILLKGARDTFEKFKREAVNIADSEVMSRVKEGSGLSPIISVKEIQVLTPAGKPITMTMLGLRSESKPAQLPNASIGAMSLSDQKVSSMQSSVLAQAQASGQTTEQEQKAQSIQLLKQSQMQTQKKIQTLTQFKTPDENKRPAPILPIPTSKQVKSGNGLFDVLVKKQGKYVKIGGGYSDLATAFNRGKQEIKTHASRSFKIVSNFGIPQKLSLGGDRTLRYSKVDRNAIVQKREFSISSQGEKNEISRKGSLFTRAKKSMRKVF